jgi:hypothetical protein
VIAEVESIDRVKLGKAVMNFTKKTLEKAEEALIKLEKKKLKIIHVKYEKIVKNPKKICEEVFENVFLLLFFFIIIFFYYYFININTLLHNYLILKYNLNVNKILLFFF